jgi:hypothetical protein
MIRSDDAFRIGSSRGNVFCACARELIFLVYLPYLSIFHVFLFSFSIQISIRKQIYLAASSSFSGSVSSRKTGRRAMRVIDRALFDAHRSILFGDRARRRKKGNRASGVTCSSLKRDKEVNCCAAKNISLHRAFTPRVCLPSAASQIILSRLRERERCWRGNFVATISRVYKADNEGCRCLIITMEYHNFPSVLLERYPRASLRST